MPPETTGEDPTRRLTLEAFADTIIPGEKRFPNDRSVAGAATGGGAVAAGAVELLEDQASGLFGMLDSLVLGLNAHADGYAAEHGMTLDGSVPGFVALPFAARTALVSTLLSPEHPEREMWVALAMFSTMAFDSGAHSSTVDLMRTGHAGLDTMGFMAPDSDGLWRFPEFSYRRPLAELHPLTTPSGSPA